jgi:hypothetical protein
VDVWFFVAGSLLAFLPWSAAGWARAWSGWGGALGDAGGTDVARAVSVGLGATLLLAAATDLVAWLVGRSDA